MCVFVQCVPSHTYPPWTDHSHPDPPQICTRMTRKELSVWDCSSFTPPPPGFQKVPKHHPHVKQGRALNALRTFSFHFLGHSLDVSLLPTPHPFPRQRLCEMGLPASSQLTRAVHTGHQGTSVKDEDQIPEWGWRG